MCPEELEPNAGSARKGFDPTSVDREEQARIQIAESRKKNSNPLERPVTNETEESQQELDEMLYSRHVEISSLEDLTLQRGTNIPALYNQVYKFIQNPSSVSVETFKRMVDTDDTIGSGVDFLITCLAARMGRYTHKSPEISEWVNARLAEIDGGETEMHKNILSATWAGFSVCEKVWANTDNGFVLKKLVPMPPGTILFETERTGELTPDGILQYQRNYNPALFGSGSAYLFGFTGIGFNVVSGRMDYRPDAFAKFGDLPFPIRAANIYSYLSIRIPIQKCVKYSFNAQGSFGNHYGRSLLRRAYKHWVMKDAILQMMATALDRKGTPLTIVYVDPNATFIDAEKIEAGQRLTAQEVGIRAQQAVRKAFEKVHNDTVMIMPGKKGQFIETDFVPQQSNATDFIEALKYADRSMMRSMLLPALIFTGGDGSGSYSLGQEHAKTFDKICDGVTDGYKQVLIHQIIGEMIKYNFPESAWKKDGFGDFNSRELSMEEREKEMACIQTAVNIGAMTMEDLDDLNKAREIAGAKPAKKLLPKPELPDDDEGNGDNKDEKDNKPK